VQYDVSDAIEELVNHPLFVPHQTPVSINVSSTDALLPQVQHSTFKAIELLESKRLCNPFGVTTKLSIPVDRINFLKSLKHVRPIIFVSLALLPRNIEPVPVQPRIENLKKLKVAGIPSVLYFRPIVPGWNDSSETIQELLSLGETYCAAICIGGLRVSPEIESALTEAGVPIPSNTPSGFHSKSIEHTIETRIFEIYDRLGLRVPLFKHTSCAVSEIMKWPNYNTLYLDAERNCTKTCPQSQQHRCNNDRI
jgi:DNA repair photolyase